MSKVVILVATIAVASAASARTLNSSPNQTLTLQQCVDLALAHNTDVRLAEQGLVRSKADARSARARRLPNISTNLLGFSRSRTGPSLRIQNNPVGTDPSTGERIFVEQETRIPAIERDNFSLNASLNHTLYDAGEGRYSHDASRAAVDGALRDYDARQIQVVFAVKEAYFGLLKAVELGVVQQESLELSRRRLDESQARLEVGVGTRVDMLRLQVAAQNARADLINEQQQERLAVARLNYLTGRDVLSPLTVTPLVDDELVVAPSLPLLQLVSHAQAHNPDLARLLATVRSAELSVKSARAGYFPLVKGNLSYSRSNEVYDRVYGNLSQEYRLTAGLSVTYNVFDGGIRAAGMQRSKSSLNSAQLTLEQRQRDVALSVETVWLELERLQRILVIAASTVELATEDLTLAEERYRVGKGTLLGTLDAQVNFTTARSNLVRTRYDLAIAHADLQRLLGSRD